MSCAGSANIEVVFDNASEMLLQEFFFFPFINSFEHTVLNVELVAINVQQPSMEGTIH
jgi:hypothetical protein